MGQHNKSAKSKNTSLPVGKSTKFPVDHEHVNSGSSWMSTLTTLAFGIGAGIVHMYHVSTLYENDMNFSLLSTMEREMGFRTEMGLYYSYFKSVVESNSALEGLQSLYANNLTEYPDTINVLERFNVYPELFLGLVFRLAENGNWLSKTCWRVDRGEGLLPVQSCEGFGDPAHFYLAGVWLFSGLTVFCIFSLASYLSSSRLGGLLAVSAFFFNHEECTRVMWTPPLRESFGYPLSLLQICLVSKALNDQETTMMTSGLPIGIATMLYLMSWQFAQFTLFTQVAIIVGLRALRLVDNVKNVIRGLMLGLIGGMLMLFMNDMLLTSWLLCSLLSGLLLLEASKVLEEGRGLFYAAFVSMCVFLLGTLTFKLALSKALAAQDDDHVANILKSKISDYRDFDTMLYACAREFDFLGWEMPRKTTLTLLLPSAILAAILVVFSFCWNLKFGQAEQTRISGAIWYNLGQTAVYCVMAAGIMRLKLFFTPHLCILAGLLAKEKLLPRAANQKNRHVIIVFMLMMLMSIQGYQNLKTSHSKMGVYSDPPLEALLEWVNENTPKEASFAGPMPLMANLMLSTRRPIVNHPHYENADLRLRTRQVYQMYSRRSPQEFEQTLKSLRVHYLVLSSGWCLESATSPCSMHAIMDYTDGTLGSKLPLLCPRLFHDPDPRPFERVFANEVYVVLRVNLT